MKLKAIFTSLPIVFICLNSNLICLNSMAQSQNEVVAATLVLEAQSEGYRGELGVYNVIKNRSNHRHKSLREICLSKYQFSCWNGQNILNRIKFAKQSPKWPECLGIVENCPKLDNTFGALFYYNPSLCDPSWAREKIKTVQIKNHVFLK